MLTSDNIDKISGALVKAQAEMENVRKTRENPFHKSKYADLADCIDTLKPVFAKHDLSVVQGFIPDEGAVTITTRLLHSSGQWIEDSGLRVPLSKNDAQAVGSSITYGRRYALAALVGLAPDDDDDGNAASAAPVKKAPAKAAQKPAAPRTEKGTAYHPAAALVDEEQAKELTAAAMAVPGMDPKLAARKAKNTKAVDFEAALKKLKDAAASA